MCLANVVCWVCLVAGYNPDMNEAIAFDTHRFVENLTESGFTEQQTEALAKEQVQRLNSNLATKVDLQAVKAELQAKNETVRAELEAKIQASKVDLIKWIVMAMIAQSTLIVAFSQIFDKSVRIKGDRFIHIRIVARDRTK